MNGLFRSLPFKNNPIFHNMEASPILIEKKLPGEKKKMS